MSGHDYYLGTLLVVTALALSCYASDEGIRVGGFGQPEPKGPRKQVLWKEHDDMELPGFDDPELEAKKEKAKMKKSEIEKRIRGMSKGKRKVAR